MGGGSEIDGGWSNKPYKYIVDKAQNKKVIILSASTSNSSWLPNYFKKLGAVTAYNFDITTRNMANLQSTYDSIVSCDAVFLRGGDQWDYINLWNGTKTEEAIRSVFMRGGVISGTSAGAMVLGEWDFTAQYSSISPLNALNDPFQRDVSLDSTFLALIPNTLFETHTLERGRMGRAIAFSAKLVEQYKEDALVIALDDQTAVTIDSLGTATVYGTASVGFYSYSDSTVFSTHPDNSKRYSLSALTLNKGVENWKYDINKRTFIEVPATAKPTSNKLSNPGVTVTAYSGAIADSRGNSLPEFLSALPSASDVTLLFQTGLETEASLFANAINSSGRLPVLVPINSTSINNVFYNDSLAQSQGVVIISNSALALQILGDTTVPFNKTLKDKVFAGVPLFASGNGIKALGGKFVEDSESEETLGYYGELVFAQGLNFLPNMAVQNRLYSNSSYAENKVCALEYSLLQGKGALGIWSNGGVRFSTAPNQSKFSLSGEDISIVLDLQGATHIDSSKVKLSGGKAPRQTIGFNFGKITASNTNIEYYYNGNSVVVSVENPQKNTGSQELGRLQVFPNPVNTDARIITNISITGQATLQIYSTLGERIFSEEIGTLQSGRNVITLPKAFLQKNGSGIYLITLTVADGVFSSKFILVK